VSVDDHIPKGELALFAFNPAAVSIERTQAIRRHTAGCAECQADLDFVSIREEDLGDGDVWEPGVGSAMYEALMAFGARIAEEDREAEELLAPLLANPAHAAWTNIALQKRYLTGGVVRKLSAHAHSVFDSEPLDALTFADAAIAVAEALPDDTYPGLAIYELRGTAWKERANALRLLGEFTEALESLKRAERAYKNLADDGVPLATVDFVRAAVLYEQQRIEEATKLAEAAELGFAHAGEDDRRMKALYLRANLRYEARDIRSALALYRQVLRYGESLDDPEWIARASYALGNCFIEEQDLGEASLHFHKALLLFREVGPSTERVRTEWGIARVFLHAGKHSQAIGRLRHVTAEFERRSMATDAGLSGLDTAEAYLVSGNMRQIVPLAQHLFTIFHKAGMLTGALTAMAYIKEVATAGTLTAEDLQAVRVFLRRVERQPELAFAPPPKPR
jgi:tetratricopeptide (TPR) repeat protein